MRISVRRTLCATAIAGGFTVLGIAFATTASAADGPGDTSGRDGLVSGNQSAIQGTAPAQASGNQVTVIGDGNDNSSNGAGNGGGGNGGGGDTTSGQGGAGSGNQTSARPTAPVQASGNQVTVIGDGNDNSSNGASNGDGGNGGGSDTTSGQDGAGSGNQTSVRPTAPVQASGNQVTVIGDGNNSTADGGGAGNDAAANAADTSGEDGTGAGNQTDLDPTAPVDASGNQVTVIGDGNTVRSDDTNTGGNGSRGNSTNGEDGTGAGNQTSARPTAPVQASGNQFTVIGDGNTNGGSRTTGTVPSGETTGGGTTGGTTGGGTTGGTIVVSGPGSGATSGGPTGPGFDLAAQGGPAATAGVLPQTGSSQELALLLLLGFSMLLVGLVLTRRDSGARQRKEVSRSELRTA